MLFKICTYLVLQESSEPDLKELFNKINVEELGIKVANVLDHFIYQHFLLVLLLTCSQTKCIILLGNIGQTFRCDRKNASNP